MNSGSTTQETQSLRILHSRLLRTTSAAALVKLEQAYQEMDGDALKALSVPTAAFMSVAPRDMADKAAETLMDQFAKARTDAQYDGLTGLHNVKALDLHLRNVIAEYERRSSTGNHAQPAVLFIDVDSFKALNDTYGHDKGDVLLKNIAATLRDHKRPLDFVARKGGDEFVIVLEDITPEKKETSSEVEAAIIQRYKELVRGINVDVGGGLTVACPISVGLKRIESGDTPESAIKAADENMYADKPKGIGRGSAERLIIKQSTPDAPSPSA